VERKICETKPEHRNPSNRFTKPKTAIHEQTSNRFTKPEISIHEQTSKRFTRQRIKK
jgi:hypothetical protein